MFKEYFLNILFFLFCYQNLLANDHSFPADSSLQNRVRFWEKIFSEYSSQQIVIHDRNDPNIILDVIDFDVLKKRNSQMAQKIKSEKMKQKFVAQYVSRYEEGIKKFSKYGKKAMTLGAIEKRIWNVYSGHSESLKDMLRGNVILRSQTGLSNEFHSAIKRAAPYMKQMEKIFNDHRIPMELTRLVFVESMFNTKAYSKVGAAGIWQLMPNTARQFINVNHRQDERMSPLKATRVAARILLDNYRELKSWPLAIMAYNHGAAGVKRGMRSIGSHKIEHLIENYRGSRFGFASQNFYTEFLAAKNVYAKLDKKRIQIAERD